VATAVLLLTHTPPEVGESVVVLPTHIEGGPVNIALGSSLMVIYSLSDDGHPEALVKTNVTAPLETPVTIPLLVIVATDGLLDTQVPPVVGEKLVVSPIHIASGPVRFIAVGGFTVMTTLLSDVQPEELVVNRNCTVPTSIAVMIPELFTVATVTSVLVQVPPDEGVIVDVCPTHISAGPVNVVDGLLVTVRGLETLDIQPVVLV